MSMLMTNRYARADAYRRNMEWLYDMWWQLDARGFHRFGSWLAWHLGLVAAGILLILDRTPAWCAPIIALVGMMISGIVECATRGFFHDRKWGRVRTRAYLLTILIWVAVRLLAWGMDMLAGMPVPVPSGSVMGGLVLICEAYAVFQDLTHRRWEDWGW